MVDRIYLAELQLNKTNSSDTEAPFLDLNLFISIGTILTKIYDKRDDFDLILLISLSSTGTILTKIYDKRDDFDFDIVNFPFLDGDFPRRTVYGVYISQLIRFARVSSCESDFNCRNNALTAKLLRQGYRYHKLRKTFSKFYRHHSGLAEKYNVSLRKLLRIDSSLRKAPAVNRMNSAFPNRWSFSYLKFTKYVINIIAEPKYKYGQQEQVTVRNHNRNNT